jgi:predicted nuclease of predicted toxin-antitoxin system
VKFLVDAQLPARVAYLLRYRGLDCLHTDDLPRGDRTTDTEIRQLAAESGRIVITKDADFLHSYLANRQPRQLLLITTGNINNSELLQLLSDRLPIILTLFAEYNLVELNQNLLIPRE